MSIKALMQLIPPPATPVETGTKAKWTKVEKRLGTKLPFDFKSFIDAYGSGEFANFYVVFNPFCPGRTNLLKRFEEDGANYTARHDDDPENYPLPMFPEVPGLIPWGCDSNGHTYFWLVKDKKKPDDWAVVWDNCEDADGYEETNYSFSSYLIGVLDGTIDALAGNYPSDDDRVFKPFEAEIDERSPGQELCEAVRKKNEKRVRELLDNGISPNVKEYGEEGASPLGCAIAFKQAPIAALLIERGADVHALEYGWQPLIIAAADSGDPESVKMLLQTGADANSPGSESALHRGVNSGNLEVVRLLLAAGAKVNAANEDNGRTPLAQAVWTRDAPMVALLLENKADPNMKDKSGITPLREAVEAEAAEIAKLLKNAGAQK